MMPSSSRALAAVSPNDAKRIVDEVIPESHGVVLVVIGKADAIRDGVAVPQQRLEELQRERIIDPRTGWPIQRFIGDSRGNRMFEPLGGSTVPGRNPVDTHTLYSNGSNYQRLNPQGHGRNTTPHGHGHLPGTGPDRTGQGLSLDIWGNVVPYNSPDAHWLIR